MWKEVVFLKGGIYKKICEVLGINQYKMCSKMMFLVTAAALFAASIASADRPNYLPAQHSKPIYSDGPVYGQLGCCRSAYPGKFYAIYHFAFSDGDATFKST